MTWILENKNYEIDLNVSRSILIRNSKFISDVLNRLDSSIWNLKINDIFKNFVINLDKKEFKNKDIELLTDFKFLFNDIENEGKKKIIQQIIENNFLLPLPSGEITDSHWTYCHKIFDLITHIDRNTDNNVSEKAKAHFIDITYNSDDEILNYRITELLNQFT